MKFSLDDTYYGKKYIVYHLAISTTAYFYYYYYLAISYTPFVSIINLKP